MGSRKGSRNRVLIAVASCTALLVGGVFTPMTTGAAGAVVNPGVTIETWPELDFVAVSGYAVGSSVTVQVFRAGTKIGETTQTAVLDARTGTGLVEINHVGNDPEEGNDCWGSPSAPNTPDITPGDEVRATATLASGATLPTDSSVVRDVKLLNTVLGTDTLTFNGWVRSSASAPVNIATDVLEVRVEPIGDRENLQPADFNQTDPTRYSHVSSVPGITADQVEEVFLEWSNAGGAEEAESTEITVSTFPEVLPEELGCPPHGDVPPDPGQAVLGATPTSVAFGDVARGSTAQRTVTVSNSGTGAATNVAGTVTGAGFALVSDGCASLASLPAGGSCAISVSVTPATTGPLSGTLAVSSSANSLSVPLSATGVAAASGEITVSRTLLGFGRLLPGTSSTRAVTVRNEGPGNLGITGVQVSGSGFSLANNRCPASLAPAQTCRIVVRFTAALPVGLRTGALTITSTDQNEGTTTVALRGRVRAA